MGDNLKQSNKLIRSFTLVELLIVIAILAVLAAAVVIVLNPAELLAQGRDSQRISDVNMMKKAVDLFIVDNSTSSLGVSQKVYISIPDTSTTCANIAGLPSLPVGWSYNCVTAANLRNINGMGWMPLDLTQVKGGSPIPYLPIDPQNDQVLTKYYAYIPGGSYVFTTLMESEKQTKAASNDGGTDAGRLEVGSDLNLWRTVSGLAGYWQFEGVGAISNGQAVGFQDVSGNNNDGTAYNTNGTGMTFSAGKIGAAVQLDGTDDYVEAVHSSTLDFSQLAISMWIKTPAVMGTPYRNIFSKQGADRDFNYYTYTTDGTKVTSFHLSSGRFGSTLFHMPTAFEPNTWHHVAVTVSSTGMVRYYADGSEFAASQGTVGNANNNYPIWIGRADNLWNGSLDEVRIYNRVLTAEEIQAIYNSGK